jgi:hypothetical protein
MDKPGATTANGDRDAKIKKAESLSYQQDDRGFTREPTRTRPQVTAARAR